MLVENNSPTSTPTSTPTCEGIKLPQIDVPSFDGNIFHWLIYLQQAPKHGSTKHSIEGLSQSGDCSTEVISCLKSRNDRTQLIHQTHVGIILEAPPLKTGDGKELHQLHNTV